MSSLLLNGPPLVKISTTGEDFYVRRDLFWAAEGTLLADLLEENGMIAEVKCGQLALRCGSSTFMDILHYSIVHTRGLYSEVDLFRGPILHGGYAIVAEAQVKLPPTHDMTKFLGQGAFGKVKRAEARWLHGLEVAVKLVEKEKYARKEAACLILLRHPNIINLHAVCTGNAFGLVLELVNGGTLAEVVSCKDMIFPFQHIIDMAEALAFVHDQGIIHRDLKPSNILRRNSFVRGLLGRKRILIRNVKLCDFGTATGPEPRSELTNCCGTAAYMAPEVFQGTRYDSRSDVYSFGILIYELFERRRAYAEEGWNGYQIMWNVSQGYRPEMRNLLYWKSLYPWNSQRIDLIRMYVPNPSRYVSDEDYLGAGKGTQMTALQ